MEKPSKEELTAALSAFDDSPVSALVDLDRTTAENYATCPFMAKAVQDGRSAPVGEAAEIGEQVHQAFGRATHSWIDSDGVLSLSDMRQEIEIELFGSRPDLQPKTIQAMRASLWSWAQFIHGIDPSNILHFDSGEDVGRSGQLALDVASAGVRLTSELDFVYAGPSKEVLHVMDYKSGRGFYSVADVNASFQFQFHALLLFGNYEKINGIDYQVWNTAINKRTYSVMFDREKLPIYRTRIMTAVGEWYKYHADTNPPTWPSYEKCSLCDAAAICPVVGTPIGDVALDPVKSLDRLIAIEASADAWRKSLASYADKHGDIHSGSVAFGRNKPPSSRRSKVSIYKLKENEDASGEDEGG